MIKIENWTINEIPDLSGTIIVITGANSGLGFEATRVLSGKNAHVIMGCRNTEKAEKAKKAILQENPKAFLDFIKLDLADLSSIREFVQIFKSKYSKLDLLFNNAGVMAVPKKTTVDGYEIHFGTNHLGHFALTGQLLELLFQTPNSRILTTSSNVHRIGNINFIDLQWENRKYGKMRAYGQSKLANLLFSYELQERLAGCGSSTMSIASHPGFTETDLPFQISGNENSRVRRGFKKFFGSILPQKVTTGVLPMLFSGLSPELKGGEFIGPNGRFGLRGSPQIVKSNKRSYDDETSKKLWQISEELTGVKYEFESKK